MAQFDANKDYYSTLGADTDSTAAEIERLYKRLAVRHHPDRGGCEEEMKALNEAYGVLKDAETRRAYDTERRGNCIDEEDEDEFEDYTPVASPSATADAVSGQFAGAALCLAAGLFLLLLVRFQWMWFLWPMVILAALVIFFGVLMAHGAMLSMREQYDETHPAHRHTGLQEAAFWSLVCTGGYGVYLVMTAV
ncbi:MAG: DnaJ domain-containing protein [Pyrinomonadaceae bacterium]|nr:DnaJ domain-containing protein [Pyrinomonadaceae bacterium]